GSELSGLRLRITARGAARAASDSASRAARGSVSAGSVAERVRLALEPRQRLELGEHAAQPLDRACVEPARRRAPVLLELRAEALREDFLLRGDLTGVEQVADDGGRSESDERSP